MAHCKGQRASRPEYNALAELGNNGWDFESLLPYFKKAQSHSPQEQDIFPGTGVLTPHQGERGPVKVFQPYRPVSHR